MKLNAEERRRFLDAEAGRFSSCLRYRHQDALGKVVAIKGICQDHLCGKIVKEMDKTYKRSYHAQRIAEINPDLLCPCGKFPLGDVIEFAAQTLKENER